MIIDFHTHTFPKSISLKALEKLSNSGHVKYIGDGTLEGLVKDMQAAGVDYSVNLPVMTSAEQVVSVNTSMINKKADMQAVGVITFGGMHPDFEDYQSEIKRLKENGIKGIKLHPAFQGAYINDIRYKRIVAEASNEDMIIITHCGADVSYPGENYASVPQLIDLIEDVKPTKFVLAHMGGWQDWTTVKNELAGAPVWLDTAYSLGPVYAKAGQEDLQPCKSNLTHEAFVELVKAHGTDKVLFATDSPWASAAEYIEFIKNCGFTPEEEKKIFYANAAALLGL